MPPVTVMGSWGSLTLVTGIGTQGSLTPIIVTGSQGSLPCVTVTGSQEPGPSFHAQLPCTCCPCLEHLVTPHPVCSNESSHISPYHLHREASLIPTGEDQVPHY